MDTSKKIIEDTLKELNKRHGEGSVLQVGKKNSMNVESMSTGCYSLDYVFACGGLPRGRMIEIFGNESSGKSSLALFLVSQVQKQGGKALWIDVEFSFNRLHAEKNGVNVDDLILSQPGSAEDALDILRKMMNTGVIDIIVLDSVAALVPEKELDKEVSDTSIAEQARLMSKVLRMITGEISRTKTSVVFINQVRDKVGIMWGSKVTTSGGKALKFFASVRLEVKKKEKLLNSSKDVVGSRMEVCAVKNKVGFPWRRCEFDLYFYHGIDIVADIFDAGVAHKIIEKNGHTYIYSGNQLGVGRDKSKDVLFQDSDMCARIIEQLKKMDNEALSAS